MRRLLIAATATLLALTLLAPARDAASSEMVYIACSTVYLAAVAADTGEIAGRIAGPAIGCGGGVDVSDDGRTLLHVNCGNCFDGVGTLEVYSALDGRLVSTVQVGRRPRAVALAAGGRYAYVTNAADGTITVVSLVDLQHPFVSRTIAVGGEPIGIVASPDGSHAYVAASRDLVAISTSTQAVEYRVTVGGPFLEGIAVSTDGEKVYLASPAADGPSGRLFAVSTRTRSLEFQLNVGPRPRGVAVSPDGRRVYVTSDSSASLSVVDTQERRWIDTIGVGGNPIGVAATSDGKRLYVSNNAFDGVSVVDTQFNKVIKTIDELRGSSVKGSFIGPSPRAVAPLVEFYHSALDHYFITQSQAEIDDLDRGVHSGWARTGFSFGALKPGVADPLLGPVCRFYGLPTAGLDSHFYSASAAECKEVEMRFAGSWAKESDEVFRAVVPNISSGACPFGTIAVYRLWNNRADSNHRYTSSKQVRDVMVTLGYVAEGYGADAVALCTAP